MAVWSYADYATAQTNKASWADGDVIITATGLRLRKWDAVLEAGGLLPVSLYPRVSKLGANGSPTSYLATSNVGAITSVTRLTGLAGGEHPVDDAGMELLTNTPNVTIDTTTDPTKTTISVDTAGVYQVQSTYKLSLRDTKTIMVIDSLEYTGTGWYPSYIYTGRSISPTCWQRTALIRSLYGDWRYIYGWPGASGGYELFRSPVVQGETIWFSLFDKFDSPYQGISQPHYSRGDACVLWSSDAQFTLTSSSWLPYSVPGDPESISPFRILCGSASQDASLTFSGIGLYRVTTSYDQVLVP